MQTILRGAALALLAGYLPAAPVSAGDFTFKRVRPPEANATRRITIQITETWRGPAQDPAAPVAPAKPDTPQPPDTAVARTAPARPSAPSARAARPEAQAWFWSAVNPGIERIDGRFLQATQVAARPPAGSGIAPPPVSHLRAIAQAHGSEILRHSVGTRVSPALVLALISVESAGRSDAVSHKGATGLMQLIPDTARRFGVADIRDPAENIRGGVAYLDWLMGEFGGDPVLALAGYNAGEGAVRRHSGVPPYAETRAYVPKVMAAWNVARTMCATPPVMPGDGCVFDERLFGL